MNDIDKIASEIFIRMVVIYDTETEERGYSVSTDSIAETAYYAAEAFFKVSRERRGG
jgi:hypothetical protein